jgi:hypothetical protein
MVWISFIIIQCFFVFVFRNKICMKRKDLVWRKHQFKTTYTDCFYQYSPDYLSTGFSSHQVLPFHTDLVPKNKNKKTLNYNKGYSYHKTNTWRKPLWSEIDGSHSETIKILQMFPDMKWYLFSKHILLCIINHWIFL